MPYKDPEKAKQHGKEYRERNKEWLSEYNHRLYLKNKSQRLEYAKIYRMENHDKFIECMAKWRINNREKQNQDAKAYYQKNKSLCFENYSNGNVKCARCHEDEIAFLTIDHIKPRKEYGHTRKTSASALYRILVRDSFPLGFQVLCYNCNMIKEFERKKKEHTYSKNKATIREVRYGRKLKRDVMDMYCDGNAKCQCCRFDNINGLSIDHISGRKQHDHSRSFGSKHLYKFLKREKFPKGFQVLCISCNSAKGKLGKCPHEYVKQT